MKYDNVEEQTGIHSKTYVTTLLVSCTLNICIAQNRELIAAYAYTETVRIA